MMFKKLNQLNRLLLKMRNREAYNNYKFRVALEKSPVPSFETFLQNDLHFKHSGNAGDIIYSLPAIYALAKNTHVHLHLNVGEKSVNSKISHPQGSVMLTKQVVDLIKPLLLCQPLFKTVDVYEEQKIDYDLDIFRQYPFNYKMGHIARWYFLAFGINADLGKPWLISQKEESMKDQILIARSFRYRTPGIDYSFLRKYNNLAFAGLEGEYEDMKAILPGLKYQPVKNFLELSSLIAGCRFFIGNQSLPFSIAEGLKVSRLLEVYPLSPNVIVEGKNGYDFCYQPQFEKLVEILFQESA